MTFIASVIAKKGVALIADSLVTTSRSILEYEDFYDYLKGVKADKKGKYNLDTKHIMSLFKTKPSHTKDYQEKLFEYDKHTAIAIAGAAFLNERSIEELIVAAIKKHRPKSSSKKSIEEKVNELKTYFEEVARETIANDKVVRYTVLIISNYNRITHETKVYKLEINKTSKADLEVEGHQLVSVYPQNQYFKVICAGQNRISERILWGELDFMLDVIPKVAAKIFSDFGIEEDKVPKDYVTKLFSNRELLTASFYDDIKMNKISDLSLQQAINLACLLMRIERDIQRYTENIPTVGGVVKIAYINNDGFKFIKGNQLEALEEFK
jgi:hypothetical protein